jgi:protein gp37
MVKCIKDYIKNLNIVIWCNIWCPYCYARTTAKRFHSVEDFNIPTFFENKLRLIDSRKDKTYFLTAQSDLSWWSKEWTEKVFKKISENKNKTFIFQTKRPELIKLDKTPDNWWFWITITSSNEKWRIKYLKENIKAKHYLITFEPMFDNIWGIDLSWIWWIVIWTETWSRKGKVSSKREWIFNLYNQAHKLWIPVFMKEDIQFAWILDEEEMIQEFPKEFL